MSRLVIVLLVLLMASLVFAGQQSAEDGLDKMKWRYIVEGER